MFEVDVNNLMEWKSMAQPQFNAWILNIDTTKVNNSITTT